MATSKLGRLFGRTETVDHNENRSIHAEKNQDIEVENDETHVLIAPRAAAGRWDDADIVHVGNTSITVNVEVYAERNYANPVTVKVTEAQLTYVAIDGNGKKRAVEPENT